MASARVYVGDRSNRLNRYWFEAVGTVPLAEAGVAAGGLAAGPAGAVLLTPRRAVGWTGRPVARAFPLASAD